MINLTNLKMFLLPLLQLITSDALKLLLPMLDTYNFDVVTHYSTLFDIFNLIFVTI